MMVGDIFAVPLENGNYGLCQVVRKNTESKWGETLTALFDIQLTIEEIENFEYVLLYKTKIITILPVVIQDSKRSPALIVKITNTPVVDLDIPLFATGMGGREPEGFTAIKDYNETHYRYVENSIADKMHNKWSSTGGMVLPNFLSNYFSKNEEWLKKNHWRINWWKDSITERDMKDNPELYHRLPTPQWRDNLSKVLEVLPERSKETKEIISSFKNST